MRRPGNCSPGLCEREVNTFTMSKNRNYCISTQMTAPNSRSRPL